MTCRAYEKLGKLKEPQYFNTWVIRILIHYCIDEQKRNRKVIPLLHLPNSLTPESTPMEEKLRLEWAIAQLSPRYRHIIILKYYQDMTLVEISKLLEKPEGTIKPGSIRLWSSFGCILAQIGVEIMHDYSGSQQDLVGVIMDRSNEIIPGDLDSYIREGIRKGREQRTRAKIRLRRRIGSGAAAILLILSCLLTVRISPVFASFMRDIPGMATFVNLIQNSPDRGLQLALDNDFVQRVDITDEQEGIKFTAEGIIVDEARVLIFYSIENKSGDEPITIYSPELSDLSGKPLEAMISWNDPKELDNEPEKRKKIAGNIHRGTIDVQLSDGLILPDQIVLKPKLKDHSDQEFKVIIPIDHAKFAGMTKTYALNKTIEVESQRVTFVKATVNPLRVSVELSYEESNSKQIFGPRDIHLVDEKGEIWNYYGGSGQNIFYFESNYFHYPKELYLEGEYFRALDQSKRNVVIDTQAEKLIQAPDSSLSLKAVDSVPGARLQKMMLSLHLDHNKDNRGYNGMLDTRFTDANGGAHYMADAPDGVVLSSSGDMGVQEIYYYLPNEAYPQPLTFRVNEYPNYIHQNYKIRVK